MVGWNAARDDGILSAADTLLLTTIMQNQEARSGQGQPIITDSPETYGLTRNTETEALSDAVNRRQSWLD